MHKLLLHKYWHVWTWICLLFVLHSQLWWQAGEGDLEGLQKIWSKCNLILFSALWPVSVVVYITFLVLFFLSVVLQPKSYLCHLIVKVSRSHRIRHTYLV